MSGLMMVCGVVVIGGLAYYCYRRRKAQKQLVKENVIESLAKSLEAEMVERLALDDVVGYFKSLGLRRGVDIPFVAVTPVGGVKSYILGTCNESSSDIANMRLISPKSVDEDLLQMLGNEKFAVLS
ncbi:MAG: hypothetical protein HUK00_09640 [Bacteroidaceae bacterium]|nr:hypothetical protein [Bacteroidaceae bacterium]